jgi:hypothetical protein
MIVLIGDTEGGLSKREGIDSTGQSGIPEEKSMTAVEGLRNGWSKSKAGKTFPKGDV